MSIKPEVLAQTKYPVLIVLDKELFECVTTDKKNVHHIYAVHEYIQGQDVYYVRKPFIINQLNLLQ